VISQRLAELMKGSLAVRSSPGRGCTFTVTLPADALAAVAPAVAHTELALPDARVLQPSGRLLYIEDNPANAELMRGFLVNRPQIELDVQDTATDGLAAARCRPPDLILLDMQLPDLPGLDVLRQLRQDPITAGVPVVVVSASAMADKVAAATAAGAADYLAKPLRLETLLGTLDHWLTSRRTA
jgi:CheY-like chemotaxis protein